MNDNNDGLLDFQPKLTHTFTLKLTSKAKRAARSRRLQKDYHAAYSALRYRKIDWEAIEHLPESLLDSIERDFESELRALPNEAIGAAYMSMLERPPCHDWRAEPGRYAHQYLRDIAKSQLRKKKKRAANSLNHGQHALFIAKGFTQEDAENV
jgi:hypothetical protein